VAKIDLSLFDISTIEAKHKARKSQTQSHGDKIAHVCDRPACDEDAYYKAPKSPKNLTEYRYFCLKHIREHNERWNYCENMTEQDILNHLEDDVVGHRPTWQSGMSIKGGHKRNSRHKTEHAYMDTPFDDPFDLAKTIFDKPNAQYQKSHNQKRHNHQKPNDSKLQKVYEACQIMGVEFPPIFAVLKDNYKKLVKQYHPDINKTDKDAEQKLRHILEAYKIVTDFLEK
jgi:hypothetical protein